MRKNLYLGLIACAALTMTGCSNDEISYDSSKQEAQAIQFDTYLGKNVQGRAAELSATNLKNFGVFASYTQSEDWSGTTDKMNFMFDQKVVKSGSDWVYTPLKYWPEKDGEKISFFAYAPYYDFTSESSTTKAITQKSLNSAAGAPQLTFTITNNASQMVDFTSCVIMNKETQDNETAVPLNFKHELARVNFAAKLDLDAFKDDNAANKTKVNIKSIKLIAGGAFNNKADYTFATTAATLGSWSNLSATSVNLNVTPIMNTATPAVSDLGGYVIPGVLVPTSASVPLFTSGEYLFLIPNSSSTTEKVTVEIEYDIVTVDSALANGHVFSAVTKQVDIDGKLFEQGKAKNYTFTIGLHEIKVTPTIEAWSETESTANPSIDGSSTEPTA